MRLFVGDDWAEDHHNVEMMDTSSRRLAKARLPEGMAEMTRLHAIIGELAGEDADEIAVLVSIETDRGPWARALVAAGYTVLAVNPLQAARFRDRLGVSGAKSDADTLELLAKAPIPARAARLTIGQISAELKRARRKNTAVKAAVIQAALRAEHLGRSEVVAGVPR